MRRQPAAVLFDMDGTLVDSEKVWDVALRELAVHAGGSLSEPARTAMVGTSMAVSMQILHDDLGMPWRDAAADASWLEARVHFLFGGGGLVWRPGAMELIREVRAAGVPTALVTSTRRKLVEVALDTLGRDSFEVVVCGDEVTHAKPDPTPYLTAAELLGVPTRPYHQKAYVTCLDLGEAGALFTRGWERKVEMVGDVAKRTKREINTVWIYPPRAERAAALASADPEHVTEV